MSQMQISLTMAFVTMQDANVLIKFKAFFKAYLKLLYLSSLGIHVGHSVLPPVLLKGLLLLTLHRL